MVIVGPLVKIGTDMKIRLRYSDNGAAFVVSKSGLLATAYHVISGAIMHPEYIKIYVRILDKTIPAKLVSFDVINDLAVLKVDQNFSKEFTLRNLPPVINEVFTSLGYDTSDKLLQPNSVDDHSYDVSRKIGKYVSSISDPLRNFFLIAAPTIHGMSGGPVLDSNGDVMGITSEGSYDPTRPLILASPSSTLTALLEKTKLPADELSMSMAKTIVEKQLVAADQELLSDWRKDRDRTYPIDGWSIDHRGTAVDCRKGPTATGPVNITIETCDKQFIGYPTQERRAGGYFVAYSSYSNQSLSETDFSKFVGMEFDHAKIEITKPMTSKLRDDGTAYICKNENLIIKAGALLRRTECTRPYAQFPNLVDTRIKVLLAIPSGKKQLIGIVELYGFRPESIQQIVSSWLNGIHPSELHH